MRVRVLWVGILAALVVPTAPAFAANQTVKATDFVFTPANVAVVQGESVTWTNGGGTHNVFFEDGSFDMPALPDSTPWSVSRTFNSLGTFKYYCEAHQLDGMVGTVTVRAPGTAPPPGGTQPVSGDRTAPALKLSGPKRQKV